MYCTTHIHIIIQYMYVPYIYTFQSSVAACSRIHACTYVHSLHTYVVNCIHNTHNVTQIHTKTLTNKQTYIHTYMYIHTYIIHTYIKYIHNLQTLHTYTIYVHHTLYIHVVTCTKLLHCIHTYIHTYTHTVVHINYIKNYELCIIS